MNATVSDLANQEMRLIIPSTESIGKLETLKPCFSLTTKYKTADDWAALKDKPIRCFYMGLKDVPNEEGEAITCGVFVSPTEVFLSGQKVLVDAIRPLCEETPLQITYKGKRNNKSTEGSTMLFEVERLA